MTSRFADLAASICFGQAGATALKEGRCPMCQRENPKSTLRDPLSEQEFQISGLCQDCQDVAFASDE